MAHEIIGALVKAADVLDAAKVEYQIRATSEDGTRRADIASNGYVPPEPQANLGLATTEQLLDELRARVEVDYSNGGGGLHYSTVHGRPSEAVVRIHA